MKTNKYQKANLHCKSVTYTAMQKADDDPNFREAEKNDRFYYKMTSEIGEESVF